MRVLVTGGAGFIGSHLTERLLAIGHHVTVLDDVSTGALANLATVRDHPALEIVQGDVADPDVTAPLVGDNELIFHLAAVVGVDLVLSSPLHTLRTNVETARVLLRQAARRRRPVLLASSSEVYGRSTKLPFAEDDPVVIGAPSVGRFSYAAAKLYDEFLALAYARERELPVVVARLFNVVGPRQTGRYGMVLPNFVARALAGEPLRVYGDGRQTRCFCHVKDTVAALVRLPLEPRALGRIVNVGSDEEISIRTLAERVIARTGSKSTVELVPYEDAYAEGFEDLARRVPDTRRVRELIDWRPTRGLEQIIDDLATSMRSLP